MSRTIKIPNKFNNISGETVILSQDLSMISYLGNRLALTAAHTQGNNILNYFKSITNKGENASAAEEPGIFFWIKVSMM